MRYRRKDFASALNEKFGVKLTRERKVALITWQSAENTGARYNPLATTHTAPGSTDYNDNNPPVQNFVSFEQGLHVTWDTLAQDYYKAVRRAYIDDEATARRILAEIGDSPWGGSSAYGNLLMRVLTQVEDRLRYYGRIRLSQ